MARMCKFDRPELVVGYLHAVWAWFAEQSADGKVRGMTLDDLSAILRLHGFPQAMAHPSVGWIKEWRDDFGDPWLMIPNWDRWLGGKELRREYEAKRKADWRMSQECPENVPDNVPDKAGTQSALQEQRQRQEQKQIRKNPYPLKGEDPPSGFHDFWTLYPRQRRQGKQAALRSWKRHVTPAIRQTVLDAVAEFARSPLGNSEYVPGPAPWLNQHRWEDDREVWARGDSHTDTGEADRLARAKAEEAERQEYVQRKAAERRRREEAHVQQ
jgi:hypothetical protein